MFLVLASNLSQLTWHPMVRPQFTEVLFSRPLTKMVAERDAGIAIGGVRYPKNTASTELLEAKPRQTNGGATVSDDAQLIDDTLAGDRAAFGRLVRKYQGRLFNTLLHLVSSREEAEDVCQEAFVQAFVKLDSFGGRSAFYTWLYRIAFNLSVSRRRRKRAEVSIDQHRERTGDEPQDTGENPTDQLLREEQIEQVRTAIDTLGSDYRAILVLREMEGCCYETIAEILDLPLGTVRSRLHRARLQLREQLQDILQEKLAE